MKHLDEVTKSVREELIDSGQKLLVDYIDSIVDYKVQEAINSLDLSENFIVAALIEKTSVLI